MAGRPGGQVAGRPGGWVAGWLGGPVSSLEMFNLSIFMNICRKHQLAAEVMAMVQLSPFRKVGQTGSAQLTFIHLP